MYNLESYFTTYENDFQRHLRKIEPADLIEVKLTSTAFTDYDGDPQVEYGFLIIYRVVKD